MEIVNRTEGRQQLSFRFFAQLSVPGIRTEVARWELFRVESMTYISV